MKKNIISKYAILALFLFSAGGCAVLNEPIRKENKNVPVSYDQSTDTTNSSHVVWRNYFTDKNLVALIDTALANNQELNIMQQEIKISHNEIKAKTGELLPYVGIQMGAGMDKSGKYTWNGQSERDWEDAENKPKYIGDFMLSANFSWELDIWKKLRNSRKAAVANYLASIEGKNFMVTNLIAEIANSYYELISLDNQLDIVQKNIAIQQRTLDIIKQQKEAARVTQLAVNRFNAQLLNTKSRQYTIQQQITETENKINFLIGRFKGPIIRNDDSFTKLVFDSLYYGVPSQLIENRPDIRQAELKLEAAKLDVKAARAKFYPSLGITASTGYQSFNPSKLFNPVSLLYSVVGDVMAPVINRNTIIAEYQNAGSAQIQAVFKYEQTVLNAYTEVRNQLSGIDNYTKSYFNKQEEVDMLNQSIAISENLFNSARADYAEVLLTQREALEAKIDLYEIKLNQLSAEINMYKALGGGWR